MTPRGSVSLVDVLIAGEDRGARRGLRLVLEGQGYRCAEARTGPETVALAWRYPRERLFNALPLLLWEREPSAEPVRRLLQKQLHTAASDWAGWVAAYKNIWPSYG